MRCCLWGDRMFELWWARNAKNIYKRGNMARMWDPIITAGKYLTLIWSLGSLLGDEVLLWFYATSPSLSENISYFIHFLNVWFPKLFILPPEKFPCMVTQSFLLVGREGHMDFLRSILPRELFPLWCPLGGF
jgi:hypothetical protein